jgi:ABC-type uncharacterized transport system permease subunit
VIVGSPFSSEIAIARRVIGQSGSPALALLATLAAASLILLVLGVNPLTAYALMFHGAFGDVTGLTETLVKTAPLLLCGLAAALAFRCGFWNIGGEGQLIIGALASVGVGIHDLNLPPLILLPAVMFAGFVAAGAWGAIAGLLKVRFGANEILVTLMMNYIAILGASFMINGPWADGLIPQSREIKPAAVLPILWPGTRLHAGILLALLSAALVYVLIFRTRLGFELRAIGHNPDASFAAGMFVGRNVILSVFLAGGFAGLAGAGEVAGIHHAMMESISPGYGYMGIVVALIGGLHPLWMIFSAFLFSALIIGADAMQRAVGLSTAMVWLLQGTLVLALLASGVLNRYAARGL